MRIIAVILKTLSVLIGLFCIPYGLLGFLGLNPAGRHEDWSIRLTGLYLVGMGILYLFPNSVLIKNQTVHKAAYLLGISPIAVVVALALHTVYKKGWGDFAVQGGLPVVVGVMLLALPAPVSLFLYQKRNSRS